MTTPSKTHPLNAKHVRTAFGISQVTLYLWRTKPPAGRTKLPCKELSVGGAIRVGFKAQDLEKWAKKHDVAIIVPFDKVETDTKLNTEKPGRKPAAAPVDAKKSQQSTSKAPVAAAKKPAATKKAAQTAKAKGTGRVPKPSKLAKAPDLAIA